MKTNLSFYQKFSRLKFTLEPAHLRCRRTCNKYKRLLVIILSFQFTPKTEKVLVWIECAFILHGEKNLLCEIFRQKASILKMLKMKFRNGSLTILLVFGLMSFSQGKNLKHDETPLERSMKTNDDGLVCNPFPNGDSDHYIIGYGSLMESASKDRTYSNTGENIPVQVFGFRREWNLKGDSIGLDTTYLGVVPDSRTSFNGVIFKLPPSQNVTESLRSYDKREHFYCRRQVDFGNIKILSQKESSNDSQSKNQNRSSERQKFYWVYVNKPEFTAYPSKQYPIVQSYVDTFMSGCLELEDKFQLQDFAKKCVETTKGWSSDYWVNDRIYPRRPFVYQSKASRIDKVLNDKIPKEFENIRIEG